MSDITGMTIDPNAEAKSIRARRVVGPDVSIKQIYAGVYRQRYVALAIVGAALAIALLITLLTPKEYSASTSVQLEQQVSRVIPGDDVNPEAPVNDSARFLQTQLDRILSRSITAAVADNLKIADRPEYLAALGFDDGMPDGGMETVISEMRASVAAELGLDTRLARITFTSRDPEVSAAIANAYADALIESDVKTKGGTSDRAEKYLLEQLTDAKAKLVDSEQKLLGYARRSNLTNPVVGNDQGGSLRSQQLRNLNDSLASATAQRIQAEQRWQQVRTTSPMSLPEVQQNRTVQELTAQRAELQAQVAQDSKRYTSRYPTMDENAAKIAELNSQINAVASQIKGTYLDQYQAALRTEQQLRGTVGQLQGSSMAELERGVGYNALQREVETNRAFYDGLLQRYKEVAAASGLPGENFSIVDTAVPPSRPSSPNMLANLALGGVLGLIVAMAVGFLRERSVEVVRTSADAERALGIPSLGVVPAMAGNGNVRDALMDSRSPQSEAYRSIAVALRQALGHAPKRLLVTSASIGEGKSTSAVALARSFAAMGKRVLLIDGDLRRPSLSNWFETGGGSGFSNLLAGEVGSERGRQVDGEKFDLMTAGDHAGDPVDLLSGDRMGEALNTIAQRYDVTIVDGPPIMGIADSILLANQVDAAVLAVEANRLDTDQVNEAVTRLPADLPVAAVLTKFKAKVAGVKYGDDLHYSY